MRTRTGAAPARGSRPRNRKAQIVSVAADLFHRQGYHAVTMEEIAGAVGITAGALYRHFRNKQDLLHHTVLDGLTAFETAIQQTPPGDIDALLREMAALTLDRRDLGVLWQREARNLPNAQRAELRHRFRAIAGQAAAVVLTARPGLSTSDADLLVWAVFAVYASPAHHAVELPRPQMEELLHGIGATVIQATLSQTVAKTGSPSRPLPSTLTRASRREALMDVAARLFYEHGYQAVSMEDIGATMGISGAGIYNHVTAKSDLLVAALTRAAEALQLDASRAFATAATPAEALELLLRSYVNLTLAHSHLTGALITEVIHLPDAQRHTIRRLQHDYVSEWVQLLTTERPGLTEPEARIITHAVLSVVNDIARTDRLRDRPHLAEDITHLVLPLCRRFPPLRDQGDA
jgi:AcrR family transcriptional regulator